MITQEIKPITYKIFTYAFIYFVITFISFFFFSDGLILMLCFNMFLANLPLLFIYVFIYELNKRKRKPLLVILIILWIIFLPNSFYLITDFIHLGSEAFYFQENIYLPLQYFNNYKGYYLIVNIFIATVIGISSSLYSMFIMHKISNNKFNELFSWLFLGIITLLSSIGIYIGRFLRFHSIDLIFRPLDVLKDTFGNLSIFSLYFIILIWIFHLIIYLFIYSLFIKKGMKL